MAAQRQRRSINRDHPTPNPCIAGTRLLAWREQAASLFMPLPPRAAAGGNWRKKKSVLLHLQ